MSVTAGTQLGHYEICSVLGAGGMGEVYLARDTRLRRNVALKLLPSDLSLNKDRLLRFEQEAYAASALNHPNILTIYEIGQTNDTRFIAAEFIDGVTLRQRMTGTQIELTEVLDTMVQAAAALAAAHQAGIVHRDIKPENIMVRHDGYVKVLDFGLAKLTEYQRLASDPEAETIHAIKTEPGRVMGTISYMSPEQTRGLEVDERSDIWGLGVVIYEMVAGKTPFDGLTKSDVIASILRTEPSPLTRFSQGVPAELQRIVKKTLRKNRAERYQTVKDLVLDLKNLRREIESRSETEPFVQQEVSSVAILPFRNLTNDPAVSFYEFSLADAVITELVRLRSLVVRPSSAIAKYLGDTKDPVEIGRELKVNAVLAASFLHAASRVRVTAQLLDVPKGEVLWGDRIDSDASDIIAVQDIIAQRIVDGLQLKLSADERIDLPGHATANSVAYEEYLRGRDCMARYVHRTVANKDIEAAIRYFSSAIELDPKFALAHGALGSCYVQRITKGAGNLDDFVRAQESLNRGLALDSKMLEARIYRVFIHLLRSEKQEARLLVAELLVEAPNNAGVHFVSAVVNRLDGDYEQALRAFDSMLRLNPAEGVVVNYGRARLLLYQGRYDEALFELDQAAGAEPHHPIVRTYRAQVMFYRGDFSTAADLLRDVLYKHPEINAIRPLLAMCLSALGEHEAARAQLTEQVEKVAALDWDVPYWLATAYAIEGNRDEALRWLEKAISLGNENLPWFKSNPVWEPLHADPRFKELMHRVEVELEQRKSFETH
ncbi:MAG TPA: protein kinase [Pyrinomonadaceae bacterium]|nr:protein kinase [Pyrinomonadaceae bacterium]